MKTIFVLISFLSFGSLALAQGEGGMPPGGGGGGAPINCAPRVMSDNVQMTESALVRLSHSPEFAGATKFQTTVRQISNLKTSFEKIKAYFSLVNVEPNEIAYFLSAQEEIDHRQYLPALKANLDLTDSQAKVLANQLRGNFRGQLK